MLIALALPEWHAGDAERLQARRIKLLASPVVARIPAHVGLVMHEHPVPDGEFIAHVQQVARRLQPIGLELDYALPLLWDGEHSRVMLMAGRGARELWHLYRCLYGGIMAAWLPMTAPFLPHVSLGGFSMPEVALAIADQWNAQEPPLRAEIRELSIARTSGQQLQWVAEAPLGEGQGA